MVEVTGSCHKNPVERPLTHPGAEAQSLGGWEAGSRAPVGPLSGASKGRQEQGPAVGAAHSGSGGVCVPSLASAGVRGAHIQHTCATCHVSR